MKIRGASALSAGMLTNLHTDIIEAAKALLKRGYFIREEAVVAAGARKNRAHIRWDVVKSELEQWFHRPLAPQSRATLCNMIKAEFDPLKTTTEVAKYLNKLPGSGNQTAGYGFLGWPDKNAAERLITNREHVGAGFHRAADRLRDDLDNSTPLLSKEPDA